MENIRIDGVDYEVTPQVAQAYRSAVDKKDREILAERERANTAENEKATETARADAAEEKATKFETQAGEASDPEKIRTAVRARVDLEVDARKVVGHKDADDKEIKLDDKTDEEVRLFVVKHVSPDLDEAKSANAGYVQARFDIAVEEAGKKPAEKDDASEYNKRVSSLREAAHRTDIGDDKVEIARRKMEETNADAWKQSPRTDKNAAAA